MVFIPKKWEDSPSTSTPITAAELNRIEEGIALTSRPRGTLPPEITSLDELNSREWNGLWHLNAGHGVTDAPVDPGNGSALVEVLIGDPATASVQRVTIDSRFYWREANFAGGTVTSWWPWQRNLKEEDLVGVLAPRGVITEPFDLDTLYNVEDFGVYGVREQYVVNGPELIGGSTYVCTVTVEGAINNAVVQRLTIPRIPGMLMRKGTGTTGSWTAWEHIAPALKVSTDPTTPLGDGETLNVISEGHVATVFDTNPLAGGWTYHGGSNATGTYSWESRHGGGRELRCVNALNRRALTWDRFDNSMDADITATIVMNGTIRTGYGAAVAARVSSTDWDTDRTAVVLGLTSITGPEELILFQFLNGVSTVLGRVPVSYTTGDELQTRLKVSGATVLGKTWRLGEPEPSTWQIQATTTVDTPGSIGVYTYGTLMGYYGLEVDNR